MEVHFVNVGQGDCTLLRTPDGRTMLVDCGSSTPGFRAEPVRDFIQRHLGAASFIDAVVITHPDADHYNLIPQVLEGVDVGHVFTAGTPDEHTAGGCNEWLESFGSEQRTVLPQIDNGPTTPPDLVSFGNVHVRVMAANVQGSASPVNARSVVLKVTYGDVDFMLTGDATFDTEKAILGRFAGAQREFLAVEVLKIGHHGSSTTSTSAEWVDALGAEVAIASAGLRNSYGHPRREVVERLFPFTLQVEPHPFRWWYTDGGRRKSDDLPGLDEAVYFTGTNGNITVTTGGTDYQVSLQSE